MNETSRTNSIQSYINEVMTQLGSGYAREHAYRPALERLMNSFHDVLAVNDPKRSENGNPDFVFLKNSNKDIILGYAEAKDITVDLDKVLKTEQLRRYAGYDKLFLTNYRDFIFLINGEEYLRASLGTLDGNVLNIDNTQALRLINELQAFLDKKPEAIKSGKRLAVIMGGKARRIRDNVSEYLKHEDGERNIELEKIYGLMKSLLVHDLTKERFADLYAQTLVYGLFAARYNDETPDDFDRREAVENVPKTNPFLRQFFNHIAGADFDIRLRYIVDELCEVFALSDIKKLVEHQAIKFAVDDEKDLTIHFYEDFLKEYDPVMRQKMGVYYTPVPVVRYIVRNVDRILKEEFSINKGLASDDTIMHTIDTQPWRKKGERKDRLTKEISVPRVQILDPAVGTATFLNEAIKHIHRDFAGQEGRWPAYVKNNLVKRLHGFELMMAPYTIAHLKLSMTFTETGVRDLNERLGVYLTNTLEEGLPAQQDLLSLLGLAGAVSEESQHAADIKSNQPIMVIIGNPPYSVSSNNKSEFIEKLVADYKKDLHERNIQPLSDDYIKFIRFAENMIDKNHGGIVAMITNNSYIDGLIHRQMRKHLLKSFDKIYVLDLHGNTKKKEVAPDGGKDENVFAIQQGVGIILAVKTGKKQQELGEVWHADLFGTRKAKFAALNEDTPIFKRVEPIAPRYYFISKDTKVQAEYDQFIGLRELMPFGDAGVKTHRDHYAVGFNREEVLARLTDLVEQRKTPEELGLKNTRDFSIAEARRRLAQDDLDSLIQPISYRLFDNRFFVNSDAVADWPRHRTMSQFLDYNNIGIAVCRQQKAFGFQHIMAIDLPIDMCFISLQTSETGYALPLYINNQDGTRTANFDNKVLKRFVQNLFSEPKPEDILDYIYAVMHSLSYRNKYKEFLKTDFPRLPIPTSGEFDRLVPLGRELRELHLMKTYLSYDTTFPKSGNNVVEKLEFADGNVWINDMQYFGNVPELAWSFYIGGYQPAQKWLKDRKGREISDSDIDHYQKIIKVLYETDRIMSEIDLKELT